MKYYLYSDESIFEAIFSANGRKEYSEGVMKDALAIQDKQQPNSDDNLIVAVESTV